jgi:hypothetical protein
LRLLLLALRSEAVTVVRVLILSKKGGAMYIPVVLKNGEDLTVDKEKFQYLLFTDQLLFFKRQNGWVVVGRDELRSKTAPYRREERRNLEIYTKKYWY